MPVETADHVNGIAQASRAIYWHRELPPRDAEPVGNHTIEATSGRVPGTLAHRDEMWDPCYQELMERVRLRLEQEIVRLRFYEQQSQEQIAAAVGVSQMQVSRLLRASFEKLREWMDAEA